VTRAPGRRAKGFTLVEVLIALLVASMMALLAHGIFSAAVAGSERLQSARRSLDREQGRHRLLTAAFLSTEIGTEGAAFDGRPQQMSFSAWMPTADGWFELSRLDLTVKDGRLVMAMPPKPPLVLLDSVASGRFDYLLELGADSRWVQEWVSPVSAPLAVRLRFTRKDRFGHLESDTTMYLIKGRG
jgi:prepilin-type N-terminal cleavage/methylation domain-containing protein